MKEFPPYRLDPVNQSLWRISADGPDEQLVLAPKAFDLLCYLLDNPGRLVTHDELLEALWPHVHVQPEVIKGQVLSLRQVLGDDARTPRFIETLRGRGYRFIGPVSSVAEGAPENPWRGRLTLTGRTKPRDELRDRLGEASNGQLQLVFVIGEPGIGKTALIEEFVAYSSADRVFLAATGQCVEGFGGTEPYYPVLEALGRLCKSPMGDVVCQHLISLAPTWAMQLPTHIPLDRRNLLRRDIAGAGRERMLREICDFLDALSFVRPLLLVFEDLHWSDYSTVDLLSALARRRSQARLMIIGSYRSGDASSNAHPVKRLSHALALRKLGHEIVLEPLSETAVADFLAGGDDAAAVTPAFASMIRARSGGNPLFIAATLDHLAERGLIEQTGHLWRPKVSLDEVELEVPSTLAQVIEQWIRRLTEEQRIVLQAASVAGVSFAPAVAACATDKSPESFEDVCEELCRQENFIRREQAAVSNAGDSNRTYSFRHSLYRQVFYDRQGPLRRIRAHRSIGDRLEGSYPVELRGEIASELAMHFGAAEEWTRALTYLRIGLQTAKQRFANREALEILDRAISLVDRLPKSERPAAEIALLEARAAVYMVEHDPRTEESYRQLATLAGQHDQIDVEARALLGLAYSVSWRDQALALTILDRAIEIGDRQTDSQTQALTRVSAYAWRVWIGGWNERDATKSEEALVELRNGNDPVVVAWASLEFSIVAVISTRYREAQGAVKAAYQQMHLSTGARREFSLERAVWSYFLGIPLSSLLLGELGDSLRAFDDGIALFSKSGNGYAVATLRLYRAWLLLNCMDYAGVLDGCSQVTPFFAADGQKEGANLLLPAEDRLHLLLIGLAKVGLGANTEALGILSEVARRMEAQPVIFDWYWRMPLEQGLTNASIVAGRLEDAQAHAEKLVRHAVQTDDRTWQGLAWETSARVSLHQGDHDSSVKFIERALDATAGFTTPLADWPVHATAALIYAATGDDRSAQEHAALAREKKEALVASLPEGYDLRSNLTNSAGALAANAASL